MGIHAEGAAVILTQKDMTIWLRQRGFPVHLVRGDSEGNLTVFTEASVCAEVMKTVEALPGVAHCRASTPGIFRVIYNPVPSERPII